MDKLKKHMKKMAPLVADLFPEEEYTKFFTRPVFSGAVTKVSKLLVDDWALVIGDAAHSTFPGT